MWFVTVMVIFNIWIQNIIDENKQEKKDLLGPTCDPSKLKLHQDKAGSGATFEQVRELVGHPAELEYVNVGQSSFYCLDGRIKKKVLGNSFSS
jgi:hypothetical protein